MTGVDLSFGGATFPRSLEIRKFLYDQGASGVSARARILERYDAFYRCQEYSHHDHDWSGRKGADNLETISPSATLPVGFVQPAAELTHRQKRPTAPARLCPMIVDRFTEMLFSRDRTPVVTVEGDEDAHDFLNACFEQFRFWRTMYTARTYGGAMGGAMVTASLKRGRFTYRAFSPKVIHDIAWYDSDAKIPLGVLIQYIFYKEEEILDAKDGKPTRKLQAFPYLYRRIIDDEYDITFHPAKIEGNALPLLHIDKRLTFRHGLNRFPGVWVQNLPDDDADFEGPVDCEGAYQMIDTYDRQISQQDRCLMNNMDPTLVIARDTQLERFQIPIKKGSENALNVGKGGMAQYLEMTGQSVTASSEFSQKLRQQILDKVQCVLVDPEKISGAAQSAKAIEFIYGPMLAKSGRLREQYGEAVERMGEITLELARLWQDVGQYAVNSKPKFELPPKMVEEDLDPDNPDVAPQVTPKTLVPGKGGRISLKWGPYFAYTPTDIETGTRTVGLARGNNLLDLETAVEQIAPLFGIKDTRRLIRKIREEEQAKKDAQLEMQIEAGLFAAGESPDSPESGSEGLPPDGTDSKFTT